MLSNKLTKLYSQITSNFTDYTIQKSFNLNSFADVLNNFKVNDKTIIVNFKNPTMQNTEGYKPIAKGLEMSVYIVQKDNIKDGFSLDLLTAFETFQQNVRCEILDVGCYNHDGNTKYYEIQLFI